MHLQAIIFDFDGVIADSEHLHLRAFQDVLGEAGIPLTDAAYYARYLGLEDADVVRAVARDGAMPLDRERLAEMLARKAARYQALIATPAVLYPGVEERVREWSRQVPLAIASGALRAEIETILARVDLAGCFSAIVAAEDVARGKPAPDGYLLALERMAVAVGARGLKLPGLQAAGLQAAGLQAAGVQAAGVQAEKVVVVEDSVWGLQAARAAGMRTVAVATNHTADVLAAAGADLIASSVGALELDMLEALVRAHR